MALSTRTSAHVKLTSESQHSDTIVYDAIEEFETLWNRTFK